MSPGTLITKVDNKVSPEFCSIVWYEKSMKREKRKHEKENKESVRKKETEDTRGVCGGMEASRGNRIGARTP